MVIYASNGTPIIDIKVDDSSYKYEEIMGDCNVYLEFALTEHVEIEPGSYILFQGVKYEMMSRESVAIQHTRNYEYKATFSGPQARFERYVMYNTIDGRLHFDMIGKPLDHLQMVINNLNLREPQVWGLGSYVDKEERLVSYNHTSVRDALSMIAQAFDTEWSVEPNGSGFVINLRKNEFNKNNPLALGYGKNQGFKPGVGRYNFGEFGQVEKVWIDGGERNLSIGEYGWTTLHFPKELTFSHDARDNFRYTINGQMYTENKSGGFDSRTAIAFTTDPYGASVKIASAANNCIEASLDLTEYYPKRVGTVTDVYYLYKGQYLTYQQLMALEEVIWEEVQVDIVDATLDDETIEGSENGLDYSQYLFSNNDPLVVIFQDGMLAGREFNATFVKEAKTVTQINEQTGEEVTIILRPANRFELERTTIDGVDMPNASFRPNMGSELDTYIVTNCYLPQEYICDFAHFKGAELDALREACKFIRENKDPQFTFKGVVDDLYSRRNWLSINGKLILGGCISFQDASIQPTPIVTRIVGIKNYVNNPYAPELTLSNETVKGGMSSMLAQLRAEDEHVIERVKEARRFSQRSFRDAKETIAMLAGSIDYFSEGINPITVETMSLLVGYEALQFRFFSNRLCQPNSKIADPTHYDPDTHMFSVDACVIQHMTHGINDVKPSDTRQYFDYIRWSMPHIEFGPLTGVDEQGNDNSSAAYYLYAKVDAANVAKADNQMSTEELLHIYGEFVLSKEKKPIKEKLTATDTEYRIVDGSNTEFSYYYLLVGILNSEYEGGRSWAPLFGFTEVLPGQITTDVIRSGTGDSFFDLANNEFALGSKLKYRNGKLTLKGALVVNGADDEVPIGAWCGEWQDNTIYARGDEVWAEVNGEIMTFRYVNSTPSNEAIPPYPYVTNTDYWMVTAKGKAGDTGDDGQSSFPSTMFVRMNGTPTKPGNNDGSFNDPAPANVLAGTNAAGNSVYWEDGIPAGEEILWATTRIFTSDGLSPQESSWNTPRQMTDTATYDVEFAKKQTGDAVPAVPTDANRHGGSGTQVWYDPVLDSNQDFTTMYWRAEREKKNGVWSTWTIIRIKGEKGDASPSLSADITNEVDGVAVGSDGVLDVAVPLSTGVMLYYGTDPETLTAITPSVPSAFSSKIHLTPTLATGAIAVVIDANTDFTSVSVVDIPITVTSAKGSRTVTYSIIPVKDGEDGSVFKLLPSHDVIKGTKSGNTTTYSPSSVTCQRMAAVGGGAFSSSSLGTLKYSVDGGSTESNYPSSGGVSASSAATSGRIIFYWYISGVLVDRETVPIVTDGKDGTNGKGVAYVKIYYGYSLDGSIPVSWTEDVNNDGSVVPNIGPGAWVWTKIVTTYTDGTTTTEYRKALSGGSGPVCCYRGEYSSSEYYYGSLERTDIVKDSDGLYYRANPLAETYSSPNQSSPFHGISPGNETYWLPFKTNFTNLATGFAFIEDLVVMRLNTAGEGNNSDERIVAEGNTLEMYDSNNNRKLLITGDELSGFPTSSTATFTTYHYAMNQSGSSWNGGGSYDYISTALSITGLQAGASLHLPALPVTLEGGFTQSYYGTGTGYIFFDIGWYVNGRKVTSDRYQGSFSSSGSYWSQSITLPQYNISVGAGTATVQIGATAAIYGCNDYTGAWNLYAYNGNSSGTITISYPVQKTEIGSNGFQVAYGSDQMLKCVISGGTTTFLMRSNDAGVEVSSSGTGTGTLRICLGGVWYYASKDGNYLKLSTTAP